MIAKFSVSASRLEVSWGEQHYLVYIYIHICYYSTSFCAFYSSFFLCRDMEVKAAKVCYWRRSDFISSLGPCTELTNY